VKVGDLVKHKLDSDDWSNVFEKGGIGVIVDTSANDGSLYVPHDMLVRWQRPLEGETDVVFWHLAEALEVISECK